MTKLIKIVLLLLLLIIFKLSISQTYNFINYNVGEGLEQSDILSVNQAANGYLLYGSNGGGLGYYDGYNFHTIKEKNGLSNNVVFSILKDKDNVIWCSTNDGISKVSPYLKKVLKTIGKGRAYYCAHYNKSTNTIYFGTKSGVYFLNEKADTLQHLKTKNEILNNSFVNAIHVDNNQNLWIGTMQNGLFKKTKKEVVNYSLKEGLPSNYIRTITESNNKLWIGSLKGLSYIKKNKVSNIDLPNSGSGLITITTATTYKGLLIFGALNNELYFVNPATDDFRSINLKNGFDYKQIWSSYTDKEGNLWLGAIKQGLIKFNSTFTFYNKRNKLLNSYIQAILCDKDETWLGYANNGINIIKDNIITETITSDEIGGGMVNRIVKIDGTVFIGTNQGVNLYNNKKVKFIPFRENKKNDVYAITKYNDEIYAGTKSGFCKLINNDTLVVLENSPKDAIYDVFNYNKKLYLASNDGYYVYSNNKFLFIGEEKGLKAGRVRSFKKDEKDNLWIGTSEGIYVLKKNEHIKIDEQRGLSSDNVYFLQPDDNGNIWAGTNKGVDRINVESFYKNADSLNIRNYSKQEGMLGVECNMNAVGYSSSNQLWIGTIDGVYLYNQQGDELNAIPPQVTLNNIKLNFNDVDWNDYSTNVDKLTGLPQNLELSHTNNNFIFEYVGVSLKNPEKVTYQYKLEGLDDDWLPFTKDKKAVYTALSPGAYTFILKAKNNDDVWVKEPTTFSFTIFPPWYQTTWFYILVIILIILGIYLFISIRTRNLKRTQQMLTQQVDERTKELREEKDKVEDQKKVIEIVNKNITDSINYAKKIQEAILPKGIKLDKYEDNLGVLYLPKDVVSGDFYWYDKLGDKLIIAAADCTGHGVPGAFMSMIGVNNLNQIILENKETNPSKILTQLNVAIKKVLRQEDVGSESKDGMDISICTFDIKNNTVQYAGAFRPLVYIRNDELIEIKGSRNPIGGNAPSNFVYELNELKIRKGDVYYMFSDGYPDQFGGIKGKKFMNKRLKQLFVEHHKKTSHQQQEILKDEFYKWMGNEEQIDDILVMCMKF